MINHELRFIFVHIPKTGGNSINQVFGIEWEDHKDLRRYAAEMEAESFDRYYKFATVRNPWERMLSDYNYQKRKSRPRDSKLFLFKQNGAQRGFGEWVRTVLADPFHYGGEDWGGEVSPGIHRWSPQVDWIKLQGRIGVDSILRMERLQDDFNRVCDALNLDRVRLPHRNRRFHRHYSWYYDDETREIVAGYYRRDIETFHYEFELSPVCQAFQDWRQQAPA